LLVFFNIIFFFYKALDYLAIGVHEIGSLSGCRMERLVNHGMSGLPAFLTLEGGLNSGFMIAHCTAAALSKYLYDLICLVYIRSLFIPSLRK
jgi:histidine ammonia-lyase